MNVDDLKSKLAEAHKDRDRLLSIVKDLEEDALKNKQKGKKKKKKLVMVLNMSN